MKFTSWLPGLAVFAVFCFSLISCLPSGSGVGEDMPEIHLPDLTDKLVSLGSFKGQVIMLNLWATWCPPCRSEIPDFIDLQNKYGADGLTIVAISLDTTGLEEVQDFCEKNKVNYPVLYAGEQGGEVMEKFGGIRGIPTTIFIDRQGKIDKVITGAVSKKTFEKSIRSLL